MKNTLKVIFPTFPRISKPQKCKIVTNETTERTTEHKTRPFFGPQDKKRWPKASAGARKCSA